MPKPTKKIEKYLQIANTLLLLLLLIFIFLHFGAVGGLGGCTSLDLFPLNLACIFEAARSSSDNCGGRGGGGALGGAPPRAVT